jgi:hypothetical protein
MIDRRIVALADMRVSHGDYSNENAATKGLWLPRNWFALYAGNDVAPARPIVDAVSKIITERKNTLETMTTAFEQAYKEHLSKTAANKVLGRWNIDMKTFLEKGREYFGEDVFDNMCAQIERVKLEITFLVIGFDTYEVPHIFTVSNPGLAEVRDEPGYWAIGNGDFAAVNMLCFFEQNVSKSSIHTVYHAFVAKFMAESATDVGRRTWGWMLSPKGYQMMVPELDGKLRAVWQQHVPKVVPSEAHKDILWAFNEMNEFDRTTVGPVRKHIEEMRKKRTKNKKR